MSVFLLVGLLVVPLSIGWSFPAREGKVDLFPKTGREGWSFPKKKAWKEDLFPKRLRRLVFS